MKILIISDSHGNNEAIDDLIRKISGVDLYLHAGDSETHPYSIFPFRTVRGNCDYYYDIQEELIIPTPFGNVLLRHKNNVSSEYIKDNDIRIVISGHTHKKECYEKDSIVFINPGAISFPRDNESSYAILESNPEISFLTFYDLATHKQLNKFRLFNKGI